MTKYVLKRDFLDKKKGEEFYVKERYDAVYFKLSGLDRLVDGQEVRIKPYEHPEEFEEIIMPDDEFAKSIYDQINYQVIGDLQRIVDESYVLIKGIENPVFREYVESIRQSIEWAIESLKQIKVKR